METCQNFSLRSSSLTRIKLRRATLWRTSSCRYREVLERYATPYELPAEGTRAPVALWDIADGCILNPAGLGIILGVSILIIFKENDVYLSMEPVRFHALQTGLSFFLHPQVIPCSSHRSIFFAAFAWTFEILALSFILLVCLSFAVDLPLFTLSDSSTL